MAAENAHATGKQQWALFPLKLFSENSLYPINLSGNLFFSWSVFVQNMLINDIYFFVLCRDIWLKRIFIGPHH